MTTPLPFQAGENLAPETFREVRLRTIFDCCKWDPQVGDTSALARYPILLSHSAWRELAQLSEELAEETTGAEREILARPELLRQLGLPRSIWKGLAAGEPSRPGPRVMRFDFHFTREGWRISEVNSDVPGGFVEADGFTRLMAGACGGWQPAGLPGKRLAESLARGESENPTIAFVHASAYSDDRQVMTFLARELERAGATAVLIDPSQIEWTTGPGARARISSAWFNGEVDGLFRFFPAEWLPNLKRICAWPRYFTNASTPQSNPGWSLISQSKRFGALLRRLRTPAPRWKALLPETVSAREVDANEADWVFKPALGRVGEAIAMPGVTPAKEWKEIRRSMFFFPGAWVAQRRFEIVPLSTPDGPRYVCLGVYTIDGRAAGIYGRCGSHPIINYAAQDAAVLLKGD